MKRRVKDVIVPEKDGVKYFPLCEKCIGTVEIIGYGVYTDPDEEFYIYWYRVPWLKNSLRS